MKKLGEPAEYRLRYFIDHGYSRRICVSCQYPFWGRGSSDRCNDIPCTDYRFFDIDLGVGPLTFEDSLNRFIRFFEKHGHEVIDPAPVVARWRDDLYLTIASIVVFQPHVTSGKIPPPANPLVIAQPSIRLEDIDNVGLTFGRHMTNFTMGGHHAFNNRDKHIYWKDETVEYARNFFVEEIGVPEDELYFKESWWEGGGNAGPCLEVSVGGLEVATLVFMQYEVVDGTYREIPLKIVDTGYGIERISWLTSKTPTAFHSVYGDDLIDRFHKLLNIPKLDHEDLRKIARYSGRIDPDNYSTVESFFKLVEDRFGREFLEILKRSITLYSIVDHTKTLTLMLGDGVVPSNTGEGYLARLVIRRTLRNIKALGSDIPLSELIKLQIDRWSNLYPGVRKNGKYIVEVIEIEEERFRNLLSKAPRIIARYSRHGLDLDKLVEIYDSHGIPPEIVESEMKKRKVKIDIPRNFYSIVASRHSRAPLKASGESAIDKDLEMWALKFPPTRRLYHEDPYLKEFTARILGVRDRWIILDSTCFYPTAGGQIHDVGVLTLDSSEFKVIDVVKIGDVVLHKVDKHIENPDELISKRVKGVIDWNRRYRIMRHHTATHIILGAVRSVLGDHIWQAGAEKTEVKGRLDVTHYTLPSSEEISRIENLANRIVDERRGISIQYLDRYEAESRYSLKIYQGGVPDTKILRIVVIPEWDAEACYGTHLQNTGEVGGIKIVNVSKIADGVVRFEYVAGSRVVDEYGKMYSTLKPVMSILKAGSIGEIASRTEALARELDRVNSVVGKYRSIWIHSFIDNLKATAVKIGDVEVIPIVDPPEDSAGREILKHISRSRSMIGVMIIPKGSGSSLVEISISRDLLNKLSARNIITDLSRDLGGRGGGRDDHASGVINADSEDIIRSLRRIVENV